METITVVKEEIKQTKKGDDYANIKLEDGRYLNLFFENFDAYEGLGTYQADIEKDGKFWKVAKGSLQATPTGQGTPVAKPLKERLSTSNRLDRGPDTNRSILVQVCIKAAAEIYNGTNLVEAGQGLPVAQAEKFLNWAEKILNPKMEDVEF